MHPHHSSVVCATGLLWIFVPQTGRFGSAWAWTNDVCAFVCLAGYFCPPGTNSTSLRPCPIGQYSDFDAGSCTKCPAGRFSNVTTQALPVGGPTAACPGLCALGRYGGPGQNSSLCEARCPPAYFGNTTGLTSKLCSGRCSAGRCCAVLCPSPSLCVVHAACCCDSHST